MIILNPPGGLVKVAQELVAEIDPADAVSEFFETHILFAEGF